MGRELETKAAQKKLLIACKDGGRAGLDVVDRWTCKELAGCGESWRPREKRKTFDGLDRERRRRRAESWRPREKRKTFDCLDRERRRQRCILQFRLGLFN
ncbi:hypothetical protein AAC387_Pa08g0468 [Persea americana]